MPQENTIKTLKVLQADINVAMDAFFEAETTPDMASHGLQAFKLLREFSERPGKRIRGALAIVAYEMFGGANRATALELAVAIELIQNYLLIIDDVMDHSQARRGGPTIHRQYLDLLPDSPRAEHLSNMLGISVGVIAQHLAAGLLASLEAPAKNIQHVQMLFHRNILATCYGQIEDLFNNETEQADEAIIKRIYILKNSYYTFINPLQTGAALAGATDEQLTLIHSFGVHAGVAFQLQDDLIGMFGDEKLTGKSSMDDLREGKMTLLIHHGLNHGNKSQVAALRAALGNAELTETQHQDVRSILEKLGSRRYVAEKAHREVGQALKILEAFMTLPGYDFLRGLLNYIIERES